MDTTDMTFPIAQLTTALAAIRRYPMTPLADVVRKRSLSSRA